jgi:penicillin-binding protein 2
MSIGQGDILITPLQLAMGISSIANGGTLWKPRMVEHRINQDGSEIVITPEVDAKIPVDARWIEVVQSGMRQTVLAGSARSLQAIPISIAGKTGTAQWSSTKNPHAWFESYAPFESPEIVTVFLIEEGREGSSVAVPAAREFYKWWAEYRK